MKMCKENIQPISGRERFFWSENTVLKFERGFPLTFSHCPHTKENRVYSIEQTD